MVSVSADGFCYHGLVLLTCLFFILAWTAVAAVAATRAAAAVAAAATTQPQPRRWCFINPLAVSIYVSGSLPSTGSLLICWET